MLLHQQNGTEKKLILGDYVAVHLQGEKQSQNNNGALEDVLVQREAFFQRIVKQRGTMTTVKKIMDSVIIVDKRPPEVQQDRTLISNAG